MIDFIVKLLLSRDLDQPKGREFDSIWVVVDRLMKMVHLVLCNESITSEQLAHLYMSYIFARHSMPKTIISNRGSPFSSQFMRAFCKKLGAKTKLSTAYHPQTDG